MADSIFQSQLRLNRCGKMLFSYFSPGEEAGSMAGAGACAASWSATAAPAMQSSNAKMQSFVSRSFAANVHCSSWQAARTDLPRARWSPGLQPLPVLLQLPLGPQRPLLVLRSCKLTRCRGQTALSAMAGTVFSWLLCSLARATAGIQSCRNGRHASLCCSSKLCS